MTKWKAVTRYIKDDDIHVLKSDGTIDFHDPDYICGNVDHDGFHDRGDMDRDDSTTVARWEEG